MQNCIPFLELWKIFLGFIYKIFLKKIKISDVDFLMQIDLKKSFLGIFDAVELNSSEHFFQIFIKIHGNLDFQKKNMNFLGFSLKF